MAKWSGLYLHGFLSSEQSKKGQWFLNQVEEAIKSESLPHTKPDLMGVGSDSGVLRWQDFRAISYPMSEVKESVQVIENKLKKMLNQKVSRVFIMGSSMGGFYAQYFGQKYQLPYVMINPALNIDELFKANLGEYVNQITGEKINVNEKYIDNLANFRISELDYKVPSLLLIDRDDEVIDIEYCLQHYSDSMLEHSVSKTIVYNGGDHSFIHLDEAWLELKQFLLKCNAS